MKNVTLLAGAVLFAALPLFAQTPAQQAQAAYEAGKTALAAGNYDKAAEEFEKAVGKAPESAEYHYVLGTAYGQQAANANPFRMPFLAKKTKEEFDRAVQLDPNHLEAHWALMEYYYLAPGFLGGGPEKAFAEAAEIKKRDNYMGHRARAWIFGRQKKMDLARKEYVDAVREEPNSARAHTGLGSAYTINDKNYKAAAEEFATALKLDPTFMPVQFRIGQLAAMSATNFAEGEVALKKYLAYKPKPNEPGLVSAWYYLGMLYEKQGKKAEAKAAYITASRLAPNDKSVQEALKRMS